MIATTASTPTLEGRLADAIHAVLDSLPPEDKEGISGNWSWRQAPSLHRPGLRPGDMVYGRCYPDGTILFAADAIRGWSDDGCLRALVAHELAHAVLLAQGDEKWNDEELADALAESWGFDIGHLRRVARAEGGGAA